MRLTFPNRPTKDVGDVQRDIVLLVEQLNRASGVVLHDQVIAVTETPIAHGLKAKPGFVRVLPKADARVWESKAPDAMRIYLKASASVTCDVEVIP